MEYRFYCDFENSEGHKHVLHVVDELTPSNISKVFQSMQLEGQAATEIKMNQETYNMLIHKVGNFIEDGRLWTASIMYDNSYPNNTFTLSSNKKLNRYK